MSVKNISQLNIKDNKQLLSKIDDKPDEYIKSIIQELLIYNNKLNDELLSKM